VSVEPTPHDRKRNKAYEKGYESGRADERRNILSTVREKFPDHIYNILYQEFQPCPECGSEKFIVRKNGEDECPECPYVEDFPNAPVDDGDSSSPVSRSESQGEGAAQGSSSQRESPGEPPKTKNQEADDQYNLEESEEDFVLSNKTKEELPTAAVRLKYENSPYGWQYSEDPEYGKLLDAKREELVRLKDVEKLLEEVRAE